MRVARGRPSRDRPATARRRRPPRAVDGPRPPVDFGRRAASVGCPRATTVRTMRSSGSAMSGRTTSSAAARSQAIPAPRPSIDAAMSIRSAARPSSNASETAWSGFAGRTIAIAAMAVSSDRVGGSPAAWIARSVATSRMTMKRHGWPFSLLPDQRAASVMASSSLVVRGSSVNWRYWRVRSSGRTVSAGPVTRPDPRRRRRSGPRGACRCVHVRRWRRRPGAAGRRRPSGSH